MDTYHYILTYPGFMTLANMANDGSYRRPVWEPLKGASHGSDMLLIFPMFDNYPEMPEEDVEVSRKLIRLLIDFGKQDKSPIDGWTKLDLDKPNYLEIGKDLTVHQGLPPFQEKYEFWNSLPDVYWRFSSKGPMHPKKPMHEKDEL